jgi:hypothetical protein
MEFRDAEVKCFASFLDDFIQAQLESVGIALLAGEGTELAAQDAVIGIVDVAVDDVTGAIAHFALPRQISNCADGIEVFAFEEPQGVAFGNAFAGGNLVVKVAQLAALNEKLHQSALADFRRLGNLSLWKMSVFRPVSLLSFCHHIVLSAMKSYLIGCDLNRPAEDYPGLIDAIKKFSLHWHHLESAWIVKSDWSAKQVRDHVKPHLDSTDELLVVELSGEGAWAGLNDEAVNWLIENL